MKHVAVDFHLVRHHVNVNKVRVVHVHGVDQIADTLTQRWNHFVLIRGFIQTSFGGKLYYFYIVEINFYVYIVDVEIPLSISCLFLQIFTTFIENPYSVTALIKALPKSAFENNLFKLGLVTHRLT